MSGNGVGRKDLKGQYPHLIVAGTDRYPTSIMSAVLKSRGFDTSRIVYQTPEQVHNEIDTIRNGLRCPTTGKRLTDRKHAIVVTVGSDGYDMARKLKERFDVPVYLLSTGPATNGHDDIFDGIHPLHSALVEKGAFLTNLEKHYTTE